MTDAEIASATKAAFKAFDELKPGEGIDISKTKTYALDKQTMIDICTWYIDTRRLEHDASYIMSDDYTIIKRMTNW